MKFIAFLIGLFLGNLSGIVMMALCIVAGEADERDGRK